jgi:hypothetical protein
VRLYTTEVTLSAGSKAAVGASISTSVSCTIKYMETNALVKAGLHTPPVV